MSPERDTIIGELAERHNPHRRTDRGPRFLNESKPLIADPRFFQGDTLEKQLSVLRHVAPAKADAIGAPVLEALREEFLKIGPNPRQARKGVY